jgi:hypothetical protein
VILGARVRDIFSSNSIDEKILFHINSREEKRSHQQHVENFILKICKSSQRKKRVFVLLHQNAKNRDYLKSYFYARLILLYGAEYEIDKSNQIKSNQTKPNQSTIFNSIQFDNWYVRLFLT